MKNLFLITEEEKSRILSLHENATKRQYLSEQVSEEQELDEDGVMSSTAAGAATGAAIGSLGFGFGAVPGAIIGGTIGLINGLINGGSYSNKGVEKILQACSNSKEIGKSTMDRATLNNIADGINTAVEGMGTELDGIKSNLEKIKTIPDLCAMANTYKIRHGESLFEAIDGDIDSESEWKNYVYLPLLNAYETSVELGKKVETQNKKQSEQGKKTPEENSKNILTIFTRDYPCVMSGDKTEYTSGDGGFYYKIKGVAYFYNGDYQYGSDKGTYKCNGKQIIKNNQPDKNSNTIQNKVSIPSDEDLDKFLAS